ncbi:MAG: phytanoyl-CoA dioxygenase family protein [Pseudomonadales bacterium]|nr:phytanoyl-CoA dioxygenase family protein [Pseudomonadales bacterium]
MLIPNAQIENGLFDAGLMALKSTPPLQKIVSRIANDLVQLANVHFYARDLNVIFPDIAALRDGTTNEELQFSFVYKAFIKDILSSGHSLIPTINKELLPACYALSRELGVDELTNPAIIRFRVSTVLENKYDHGWHQDSIDTQYVHRDKRAFKCGLWIPLHDVGVDEGSMEFAINSHLTPIPHTKSDPFGRLYFEDSLVDTYEKHKVSTSFGDILAFDPWTAHRTLPNTSNNTRFSVLIWL